MFYPGFVSISFRDHTIDEIVQAANNSGLKYIEWGSDIHAPFQDDAALARISSLQAMHGIVCCSYGTYFRLGFTPVSELPQYIQAAKKLGTNILRLWAGRKKASDCTQEERDYLFAQCRQAAALAKEQGVILCMECHRRSYTETMEGALDLMRHVNSPNFRMYWQPNPDISVEENLEYIAALQDYITHIHVFHWERDKRLSLRDGMDTWKKYLSQLQGSHHLLLEFMPDDSICSLEREAESLHALTIQITDKGAFQ